MGPDLSQVIPWDHAYWTEGTGFKSLALTDGTATPIWPNETFARGARLDGSTGLVCRGVPSSYAYVEDSAILSVTSSVAVMAYVTAQDWTPPATMRLVSKSLSTGNQRSYRIDVTATTGVLTFTTSVDGTAEVASASTVGTGFTDGTGHWVMVVFNDTANTTNFYTSDDAKDTALASITWAQLGAANVAHATAGIFDSTASLVFGGSVADNQELTGTIARAAVYSGGAAVVSTHISGGTCVIDAPLYAAPANSLTFTDDALGLRGTSGLVLPGVAGNYASVPDAAAVSVTSSIAGVAYAELSDWTTGAAIPAFISKYGGGAARSYSFRLHSDGTLRLTTSADGTTAVNSYSTAAVPFTDGSGGWMAWVWNDTANTVNFYTSTDAASTAVGSVSWTLLGTADVAHASAGIFDSTTVVEFGSEVGGTAQLVTGKIKRAAIYSGGAAVSAGVIAGGSKILDVDFTGATAEATSFTATTGQTVTITGCYNTIRVVQGGGAVVADGILHVSGATGGIVGDAAVTPDSAGASVTGDLTLLCYAKAADWTTGAVRYLVSKWNATGNQRSYQLFLTAANVLGLNTSADGTATVSSVSTVAPTVTDGTGYWLAATWNDTANQANYYQASGTGTEDPTTLTWSQVGAANVAHASAGIYDSTANVVVAGIDGTFATTPFAGQIQRAQVRSGSTIDTSTLAVDFNPAGKPNRTASWLASTGERWTIYSNTALVHQTAANQLVMSTASGNANGRDLLTSDGVADWARMVLAYGSEQPVSIVGVARFSSVPAAVARLVGTNSADSGFGIGGAATGKWSEAQTSTVTGTTDIGTTLVLLRWEFEASATASKFYVNEVEVASGDLGVVAFNRFAVGAGGAGSNFAAAGHAFWGVLKDGPVTAQTGWRPFIDGCKARYNLAVA